MGGKGYAQQDLRVVNSYNDYGGKTFEYSSPEDGLLRVRQYYAFDNKLMKEEIFFTEEQKKLFGINQINSEFLFKTKIKEETIFSGQFSKERMFAKTIDFFEQTSGLKQKTENYFSEPYMGYNIVYYKNKINEDDISKSDYIRTRIEWYYPEVEEGVAKHVEYFDNKGKEKIKFENYFTPKSTLQNGIYKSIYYKKNGRKTKQEWLYSGEYTAKNKIFVKIQHYSYHPDRLVRVETNYLDKTGKTISFSE